MQKSELREKVVDEFKSLVFGPRGGNDEFIEGKSGRVVALRYLTGILFPQGEKRSDLSTETDDESFSEEDGAQEVKTREDFSGDLDNPLSMANEELPSSVGITFVIKKNEDFNIHCSAARYERTIIKSDDAEVKGFKRIQLDDAVLQAKSINKNQDVFYVENEPRAKIHIFKRSSKDRKDCEIVTVTLVNELSKDKRSYRSIKNTEKRLYQVKLKCVAGEGKIKPYDSNNAKFKDTEENILSLQYSDSLVYAIGHGASVNWNENKNKKITEVEISYIPTEIVNRPIFDKLESTEGNNFNNSYIFNISNLANKSFNKQKLITGFYDLCHFYEHWIDNESKAKNENHEDAQEYLIKEMKICAKRMLRGVKALESNNDYWDAFVLSNQAMLIQMLQTKENRDLRSSREKENKPWPIECHENIDSSIDINNIDKYDSPQWRPFQLAFFLMCFLDFEEEGQKNREIADLIWFSTGGGKTEAYLLLASYELIRRRTRYEKPEMGYGTGVLTRYTLRFLTSDQFLRTTALGCALEKIRLENTTLLGDEQFSIGLFVGQKVSYNSIKAASDGMHDLKHNSSSIHKFHITECPSCGTSLIPKNIEKNRDGNIKGLGIDVLNNAVIYKCQNTKCTFNKVNIPVRLVDEEIYKSPPSFILGTIDKFAEVTWNQDAGKIFGSRTKTQDKVVPPTLIIQDEIHLISGPLGTISGIYEAGFDTLIRKNQRELGFEDTGPKYIASSATVRDSETQLKRLLNRKSKIFPPRGLKIKNSFFANTDPNPNNGRLYIGIMPQAFRSTSAAHAVSGAFLQSVRYIAKKENSKEALDFLWTTLCYCNSLREHGLISTSVNQEIFQRMKVCCIAQGDDPDELNDLRKEEISADMSNTIAETSDILKTTNNDSAIDFVPATNMISVGIDIDRLGSMIINGQPKTTSEYIQASSRVGRNPDNIGPGLIIALYSPAKPRDRSHYEQFKSYHQKLYRLVEPTSVTPGSAPALERALHASLILLIRHGVKTIARINRAADDFDDDNPEIKSLISDFRNRLINIYDNEMYQHERDIIDNYLNDVIDKWKKWTDQNLVYRASRDKVMHALLIEFTKKIDNNTGFRTMHSMRNVDSQIKVVIQ